VYEYTVKDEQYLFDYDPRVKVLATALFKGVSVPVAWAKQWGNGKVCYIALGHNVEACRSGFFLKLLANAARWAAEPAE
jgi:type 1 glutamine amidotransferase